MLKLADPTPVTEAGFYDWPAIARKAKRRAKKHPEAPAIYAPGLHSGTIASRMRRGQVKGFTKPTSWRIFTEERGQHPGGRVRILIEYHGFR